MNASFIIKSVYGNSLIYPVNETAQKLTSLTGKKTVTLEEIQTFKELGFTIETITNTL